MGRDYIDENGFETVDISIHSPRMGRDILRRYLRGQRWISIHSPRRQRLRQRREVLDHISIHSPRMGRDIQGLRGRATAPVSVLNISIHSPRMGRDPLQQAASAAWKHFNPLSPHGERQQGAAKELANAVFQSTLPAWGETISLRSI